jgi:hypothetical protein
VIQNLGVRRSHRLLGEGAGPYPSGGAHPGAFLRVGKQSPEAVRQRTDVAGRRAFAVDWIAESSASARRGAGRARAVSTSRPTSTPNIAFLSKAPGRM